MINEEYEQLKYVYVQMFHEGCPDEYMLGTEGNPAIMCGRGGGADDRGFTMYYADRQAQSFLGIITPAFLILKYGKCRVNIQVGDTLFRDVEFPVEADPVRDGDFWSVRVGFVGDAKGVLVRI
jgi:hypothetical protein